MRRREFISFLGGATFQVGIVFLASAPFAEAQEAYRIGLVSPATSSSMASRVEAFRQGLREFGYIEGKYRGEEHHN